MVHGDPSYQYGRVGEGGLDIQRQTMRKNQHSIKHEASVDRQQLRDCKNAAQKSIVDFENGDGEAKSLTKLLATVIFICRSDSPIVLFVTLIQFMAEMGMPDMPLKDPGTYYSEYGFAQLVETLVIYLRAQQMKHIRESPYLGIQLDESTDRRRGKHLIVYLSFLRSNTPVTEFFAHLTVEQCDARSLQAVLLTHLESTSLDLERISGISSNIKKPPVELTLKWISTAWKSVPKELIQQAFLTCGISNALDGSQDKLCLQHRRDELEGEEVDMDDEIAAHGFFCNNVEEPESDSEADPDDPTVADD
ncbi:unnamed protein product [Closterium sp. NIES-54]